MRDALLALAMHCFPLLSKTLLVWKERRKVFMRKVGSHSISYCQDSWRFNHNGWKNSPQKYSKTPNFSGKETMKFWYFSFFDQSDDSFLGDFSTLWQVLYSEFSRFAIWKMVGSRQLLWHWTFERKYNSAYCIQRSSFLLSQA